MLRWGLIGTGSIARKFASSLPASKTGKLVAVGSRAQETADKLGEEFDIERCYPTYEALLADSEVDAVYISPPHPMHAEWAVKAAEAGKHILCEKPLTMDYAEAMAVIDAARRNDVFLMEAFMYRCHPQTARIAELVREKAIGEVRLIQAAFGFDAGWNPEGRLLKHELGGGGILDVGCYAVSMSRLVAGMAIGTEIAEPVRVKAAGHIGATRVDEYAVATLVFPNDIIAQVSTSAQLNQENAVRIFGTAGSIYVPSPWFCGEGGVIHLHRYGKDQEEITTPGGNSYALEADVVAEHLDKRQAPAPAMSWADSLGNMRALDAWRMEIGLVYDFERTEAYFPTIDHKALAVRPGSEMSYGRVDGLDKDVSRVVMGVMIPPGAVILPHVSIMFDEFFERGGNCFDTAHIYGPADQALGQWMKNRGVREQVVVLGKGAHTPWCNPPDLTAQLIETLDRMQTDYLDIYMMHRDNPEIPVGEFVDVLNEHVRAGRIRAFGGSNWRLDRIDAANEYARSKGLQGFTAVSNNFSLARMIEPPWAGCLAASDAESREWFERTQTPLMAWSSLARGFFARGNPEDQSDPALVMCWYADDNFRRLARAKELAAKYGVEPVAIAMAYVLSQPFPVYALFGPANIDEMRTSLEGLGIRLTVEELKWLNLEQ